MPDILRVSLVNGPGLIGGSQMQLTALCPALRHYGIDAITTTFDAMRMSAPQVVHLSHINAPWAGPVFAWCRNRQIPLVVKCIFSAHQRYVEAAELQALADYASVLTFESQDELRRTQCWVEFDKAKAHITRPGVHNIYQPGGPVALRSLIHTNGRYAYTKGMRQVIAAASQLGLPVLTCGWPEDAAVFEGCRALGYGEVLSAQDPASLCDIYHRSRVYVCNSVLEQHSTSVAEAVACGCLVLSTVRHAANAEYPHDGYFTCTDETLVEQMRAAYDSSATQQNITWSFDKLASVFSGHLRQAFQGR
jgi:glycosyltransferase involved in cell wall biosynthesis